MKKYFNLTGSIVAIAIIFLSSGCAGNNFQISKTLQFEPRLPKIPLIAGIYISEESRNKMFEVKDTGYSVHSPIGPSLEPNAISAFNQLYENSVLVSNKSNIPENIDVLIELSFGENKYKYWNEGHVACRLATVELIGTFYNKKGEVIMTVEAAGETPCRKWQCEVKGKKEGMGNAEALVKTLFLGPITWMYPVEYPKLLGLAVSASLQEALDNMSEKVLANKQEILLYKTAL